MNYAPQGWLADFSAMTDEIVRSNESMDIDEMDSFQDQGEVDSLVSEIMHRKRKYKPRTITCQDCGETFVGAGAALKYCPKCKAQRKKIWQDEYRQRHGKRAKAKEVALQEEPRNTAPVETVLVNRSVEAHDVKADDVPDVPADDYYSEADKIKKAAPIETVLVPKKEDKEMDTERAERLKTSPSMSNRLEHPEYFTGDTPESLGRTKTVPDDYGTAVDISPDEKEAFDTLKKAHGSLKKAHGSLLEEITSDKKRMLLALYDGMSDMCMASGMTFAEMLDRMSRLHAALS